MAAQFRRRVNHSLTEIALSTDISSHSGEASAYDHRIVGLKNGYSRHIALHCTVHFHRSDIIFALRKHSAQQPNETRAAVGGHAR